MDKLETNEHSINTERVKVVLRCRPMNKKEIQKGFYSIVKVFNSDKSLFIADPNKSDVEIIGKNFSFDAVYDETFSQEDIYQETVSPFVKTVLKGYNATIMVFGQTGAGKTYTMEGLGLAKIHSGLMPRAFLQIFDYVDSHPEHKWVIRCSYLQLYQDEIKDLLNESNAKRCTIQGSSDRVNIKNLQTYECKTAKSMFKLMMLGNKNRVVRETAMNECSSRSHAIFTIRFEMSGNISGGTYTKFGKLNLVDLAGSERQTKTESQGQGLKESAKNNLSLIALGKVITALTSDKYTHIPYRDSKLTTLLQDSLGGKGKTLLIANIGPANDNYSETLSTLMYATRTKFIKNIPNKHEYIKQSDDNSKNKAFTKIYCIHGQNCEEYSCRTTFQNFKTYTPEQIYEQEKTLKQIKEKTEKIREEKEQLENLKRQNLESLLLDDLVEVSCFRKELDISVVAYKGFRKLIDEKMWNCEQHIQNTSKMYLTNVIKAFNIFVKDVLPVEYHDNFLYHFGTSTKMTQTNETLAKSRGSEPKLEKHVSKFTKLKFHYIKFSNKITPIDCPIPKYERGTQTPLIWKNS